MVSGALVLRARLSPEAGPVLRLVLTADGQQVCTREAPPFECPWDAGKNVAAHHVRALAILRDGRRLVANVRTKGARFAPAVEVEVVQVAATVTDKGGRFVKGLGRDVFRIFEDGVRQPVTHFIGEGTARELVVAVDMSGSMEDAMPACRAAVKQFLAGLRPDDQLTLLAFNDNVFTLAARETDPAARQRAVDRLAPWGGTALHDVVLRSLDLLDRQRGRRALVLFTDGEDRSSHATVEDVERRVEMSAAPIYVIAQGKGMRERELKRGLDRLADVSGGRAFFTDSVEEAARGLHRHPREPREPVPAGLRSRQPRAGRIVANHQGRGRRRGGPQGAGSPGLSRDREERLKMRTLAFLLLPALALAQQPPVFEAKVDVVAVDVNVIDAVGKAVRGLKPEDFKITVDGVARTVLSAEFMDFETEETEAEAPPPSPYFSTNEGVKPGRLILIAVDQGHIGLGNGRTVLQTADRLLDKLTPRDRTGLVAFPAGVRVEFTGDHRLVREALGKVVGQARRLSQRVSVTEAMAHAEDHDVTLWSQVTERECPSSLEERDRAECLSTLETEAQQVARDFRAKARNSLDMLAAIFEGLKSLEGPKTLVLITEGMGQDDAFHVRQVASLAAAARVSLFVLQIDSPLFADASQAAPVSTRSRTTLS